jgi:hypothetical protein
MVCGEDASIAAIGVPSAENEIGSTMRDAADVSR